MSFLIGLGFGVVLGIVVGTVGSPVSMRWFARREHREASEEATQGPFPRIEVDGVDRSRFPDHVS